MASDRQVAANRRNAAKSTGPRTQQGKARSRMNALRHGFAASGSGHLHKKTREKLELWLQQIEFNSAVDIALLKGEIKSSWSPEMIEQAVRRIANQERYKARIFTAWKKKIMQLERK